MVTVGLSSEKNDGNTRQPVIRMPITDTSNAVRSGVSGHEMRTMSATPTAAER